MTIFNDSARLDRAVSLRRFDVIAHCTICNARCVGKLESRRVVKTKFRSAGSIRLFYARLVKLNRSTQLNLAQLMIDGSCSLLNRTRRR